MTDNIKEIEKTSTTAEDIKQDSDSEDVKEISVDVSKITKDDVEDAVVSFWANIFKTFEMLLLKVLSLKETGKWVSVITLFVVLKMFNNFLWANHYDVESMKVIGPYLGNTITWVFGIVAGAKTIQGTASQYFEKMNPLKGGDK